MNQRVTFGFIVKERRHLLGLTQAELGRRVGCAAITIRKIEADSLRPSVQVAQLVARLEHPHIVPLYDYWREPRAAYLIMRLLRGGSLEVLLKEGPLKRQMVLHVMEQICAGLHVAHRAGVIHRDIKPANILLDDDSNAYLADFGIAKHVGSGNGADVMLEGTVIGSPAYISPLLYVGFSADGRYVLTDDAQTAYRWRTSLEDVTGFACAQLSRDLTAEERTLYNIIDNTPTCHEFTNRAVTVEPTWTPIPPGAVQVTTLDLEPVAQATPEVIAVEFLNDAANLQVGAPMQDVFIEAGEGLVVRPQDVSAATLAQPLYRATELIEPDFLEEPFEVGPFAMGEPHGFTLADWLAATGQGTYTVTGNRARIEFTFDNLVPHGVYTLWCSEVQLPPIANVIDRPCGAPDGSDNVFIADEAGHISLTREIEALPHSGEDTIYSFGLAYHSDGQTYGSHPGEFGYNLHVQLFYELPMPSDE